MTQVLFGKDEAALDARLARYPKAKKGDARLIIGTPSQVVDQIGAYVDAGVQRFMLQWLDLDDLDGIEGLAKAALPVFHKG